MRSRLPLLLLVFTLCSAFQAPAQKLQVITTFAPIQCFAANVAGEAADVRMLLPPGTGPHDYAFSPGDIRKLSQADMVIFNGVGLEEWLDKGIKNAGRKDVTLVDTSQGISVIEGSTAQQIADSSENDPEHHEASEGEHHHDEEGGANPHIWLSPQNAIRQVENIRDALVAKDPSNAETYRSNATSYIDRLKALDTEIETVTAKLANKNLVTFHDTFPYFAQRYGFKVVATFEAFPGKEPSPRAIKELREVVEKKNVSALFAEPQFSPKAMKVFAQEFKLPVAELDPMETGDGAKDFYERVTRKNLAALIAAFDAERSVSDR
jgi:zinc transport system substrate-binding protein